MSTSFSKLPALMVWRPSPLGRSEFKSLKELAAFLQVDNLRKENIEDRDFRKQHQISLEFEAPGHQIPLFELDIVTLANGERAYVWCNDQGKPVITDNNQREYSWQDVDFSAGVVNYYLHKELFRSLFPKAGY